LLGKIRTLPVKLSPHPFHLCFVWDRVLLTLCLGWPGTPWSSCLCSQVAEITDTNHHAWLLSCKENLCLSGLFWFKRHLHNVNDKCNLWETASFELCK
jgi:hypothetical protein